MIRRWISRSAGKCGNKREKEIERKIVRMRDNSTHGLHRTNKYTHAAQHAHAQKKNAAARPSATEKGGGSQIQQRDAAALFTPRPSSHDRGAASEAPHAGGFPSTATRFGVSWVLRSAGKCGNTREKDIEERDYSTQTLHRKSKHTHAAQHRRVGGFGGLPRLRYDTARPLRPQESQALWRSRAQRRRGVRGSPPNTIQYSTPTRTRKK